MSKFANQLLADLARQVAAATPAKKQEQVRKAEKLHDELDADTSYPLDFVIFRVTGYRSSASDSPLLEGEALRSDLRTLIDVLSRAAPMSIDDAPVESTDELAERLNVSTKTITRWRKLGLRWRWVRPPGARRNRLMFTHDAVEHFQSVQQARVERAATFTQMPDELREQLLRRARRIAEARDVSMNQIAKHLSRRVGRAQETIRTLLEHHDRDHPDDRIFVDRTGPLTDRQKCDIARAFRRGARVRDLTKQYRRTRTTIYRAIYQRRADVLRRLPLRYVTSPMFAREDADEVILKRHEEVDLGAPRFVGRAIETVSREGLPEALWPLYSQSSLTPDGQWSLVVRLNFLKFRADQKRREIDMQQPRVWRLEAIERDIKDARALRSRMVRSLMPLALVVARRHLAGHDEATQLDLLRLLDVSLDVLIDGVDAFEIRRNQPVQTYITYHLMRRYASVLTPDSRPQRARRRDGPTVLRKRMLRHARGRGIHLLPEAD